MYIHFKFLLLQITNREKNLVMGKFTLSSILKKDTEFKPQSINKDDEKTSKFIQETKKKQDEILRLKEVNRESLQMVVQL